MKMVDYMFYTQPYLFFGIFLFIFWTALFNIFLLIFLISTHFRIFYSSFLTTIYSLYFSTSFFEVHSLEMGSHASYMQLSTSFLLLNILSQKFHQSSVCSSSKLFTPIFQCQRLVTCHTHRPIFSWGFW